MRNQSLRSYIDKMFQGWLKVNWVTFSFLCEILKPSIKKIDTLMTTSVDIETRVAMTLAKVLISNSLFMIGDLYGIVQSTTFVIV